MGTISENLLDSDGVTAWFPAGKYLTSVSINLIDKEYTMLFFDLQNKKEAYEKFLDGFAFSHQPPEIIEDAKKAIEMLKLTYQGRQDEFKLVVGSHIE